MPVYRNPEGKVEIWSEKPICILYNESYKRMNLTLFLGHP
jgi:hypothetical protein